MTITDRTVKIGINFAHIKVGEVFRWKENFYMKVSDDVGYVGENKINTYALNERELIYTDPYIKVEPISSELILRDKEFANECVR